MEKVLVLWVAVICGLSLHAQEKGVEFRNISYQEALDQAQTEKKLVFVDCYTSWCGPCQHMLKKVFPLPEVGAFFNTHFVNVKFDMEKGEGIELRKKFGIKSYPTFLLIRPDGIVQHRIVGGGNATDFMERVNRGMQEENSLYYLEQRYVRGKLSKKQQALYMQALKDAKEDGKIKDVSGKKFHELSEKEKCRMEYWNLYEPHQVGPGDERFEYLLKHKKEFDEHIGQDIVDEKIYRAFHQILMEAEQKTLSAEVDSILQNMSDQLTSIDFKKKQNLIDIKEYIRCCNRKDIDGTLDFLENKMESLNGIFLWNVPFRMQFIEKQGTVEQLERLLALEPQMLRFLNNSQIEKIAQERFEYFRTLTKQRKYFAEIKGRVEKEKMAQVRLYKVQHGTLATVAQTSVGENGLYGFSVALADSGYYLVGGEKDLERIRIYLKPGDRAEVNILEDTLLITENNTYENRLLAAWQCRYESLRRRVWHLDYILYTYKEFFPYFLEFLPEAQKIRAKINSKNESFNELLRRTIDYDLDYTALAILRAPKADPETHKPGQPKPEHYSVYYKTLVNPENYKDDVLLRQPYGVDFLNNYTRFALEQTGQEITLANRLACIPDSSLRAELVLWAAGSAKSYERFRQLTDPYADLLKSVSCQKRWNALCAKLYVAEAGKEAADFTYPDRFGKMVSLSDFKGKVVLVDVWATWCGPCRAEIPYLRKIEEEMKDTDVVFIGVSVDEKKNYQKWKKVLDEEKLAGIQLFAEGWSKITEDYKIKGIPRFMVFDRQGRVVSANAPRPSDTALKVLLNKVLNK